MMQVLIVDDEDSVRRLLRAWIEAEGGNVVEATNPDQALELAAVESPAVAFCDLRMSGRTGLWLADRMREDHPHTAVIVATGVHDFDVAVASLRAGAVDYLTKPFTRGRLLAALQRACMEHTSRRAVAAMQQEIEEQRKQIIDTFTELEVHDTESVSMILKMLQHGSPGSYERAHRVARLVVNLALMMEVREPELSEIERAALLHQLPEEVRGKPSELATGVIRVASAYDELVHASGSTPLTPTQAVSLLSTNREAHFDTRVLSALTRLCRAPLASLRRSA